MKGTAKYLIVAFITLMSAMVVNAQPGGTDTTIVTRLHQRSYKTTRT